MENKKEIYANTFLIGERRRTEGLDAGTEYKKREEQQSARYVFSPLLDSSFVMRVPS